ncbi:unnamed protein product, partial [Pylaiella littoralis]
ARAQALQSSRRVLQPVWERPCFVPDGVASSAAGGERPRRRRCHGGPGPGGSSWVCRPVHQRLLRPAPLGQRPRPGHSMPGSLGRPQNISHHEPASTAHADTTDGNG